MKYRKNKDGGIPFVMIVIILIINFSLYKWDRLIGIIFFTFYGFWFLGYGLYKIAKIFKSDL